MNTRFIKVFTSMVAGDFNAQVGSLNQTERNLSGYFGIQAQQTDIGDHLLQLCSDNRPFLTSTAFKHKERHCLPSVQTLNTMGGTFQGAVQLTFSDSPFPNSLNRTLK
ncbi:unnamed protein product [Schistosoma rodhaini]|uniref:Endonuclease/exonuclease/phosphatase domain-containing protein n=1 Tax=Schistosoma rodhaini TaxID=6188 RepID=A0AA85FJW8_9TREM|nr:unnamed protein product [Schistosoma rodhaini]